MRHALAGWLLMLLASACGREAPATEAVRLRPVAVTSGDYLDQPTRMAVVGNRLVLLDRSAPMAHVFELPGLRHLGSFGTKGNGPGEFRHPTEVQNDPDNPKAFWIYDSGLVRMTQLEFVVDEASPKVLTVINIEPSPLTLYFQPVWLSESQFVATGIYPSGRLAVADQRGRRIGAIGDLPSTRNGLNIPVTVLQHAYTGRLVVSPERARIALAMRHADSVEIYRVDGTLLRKIQGGNGFGPVYEVRSSREGVAMASGDDLRFGYVDLSCTSKYIFALYSGTSRGELPGRAVFGQQVQVFSWQGERLATFQLPQRALSLAVDETGKQLIVLQHEPEPTLVRYPLPKIFTD